MAKSFMEVFPGLKLSADIGELFSRTEVERVTTTRNKDLLRIYLNSERLIQKSQIYEAEQAIKDQLFPRARMNIKIIEKFHLSEQYSPRTLMEVYYDSILTEFKNYSRVEYNLFSRAKWEFPEDRTLKLQVPDSIIAREKSEEILRILEKIFCERCGMDLIADVEFLEAKESRYRKDSEQQIAREIQEIVRQTKTASEGAVMEGAADEALPWEADGTGLAAAAPASGHPAAAYTPEAAEGKKNARQPFQKNSGGFGGSYKRSDHPDVLYGRDFDDDAVAMDQILGEMGEVTIHGQISSLETREIRERSPLLFFMLRILPIRW